MIILLTAACGGGGGSGDSAPAFTNPTVSPEAALWGTWSERFVVSGGVHLEGRSFTATLGSEFCHSVTVDDVDPSKLIVLCRVPLGGPSRTLPLEILFEGRDLTGGQLLVTLDWPQEGGLPMFTSTAEATSGGTWWQRNAPVTVTGGVALAGHTFTALLDGVPCASVELSSAAPGTLNMTCSTRPGGPGTVAKLVLRENSATVFGGEFDLDLSECADPGAPATGVPLPQLCNAAAGSTAAVSSGLEGAWWGDLFNTFFLLAPDGSFQAKDSFDFWAGRWTADGSAWTPSIAEHMDAFGVEAFTTGGTYVPFTSISAPAVDDYLPANALAVSQDSIAGVWGTSTDPLQLLVGSTGTTRGTTTGSEFGTCTLTGTITVLEPPRNMLIVALTASGGTECKLWRSNQLTGLGFIDVVNVGSASAPSYAHDLVFMVRSAGQFYMAGSALQPQPRT